MKWILNTTDIRCTRHLGILTSRFDWERYVITIFPLIFRYYFRIETSHVLFQWMSCQFSEIIQWTAYRMCMSIYDWSKYRSIWNLDCESCTVNWWSMYLIIRSAIYPIDHWIDRNIFQSSKLKSRCMWGCSKAIVPAVRRSRWTKCADEKFKAKKLCVQPTP